MTKKTDNYLFNMIWGVSEGGYEIAQDMIQPKNKKWKTYDPFEGRNGIVRKFASIPVKSGKPSKDAVITFANEYGLLGLDNSYGMEGESLETWYQAVLAFRYILKQIKAGDQEEALHAFNGQNPISPMKLRISNDGSPWQRSFGMAPTTLYGALWLMLGNEIISGSQFQKCKAKECSEWLPIRSNHKYCSNACRQSAYRKRQ